MALTRSALLAGLGLGFFLAVAPSCGPTVTPADGCGPDNCIGCCDGDGACQPGTAPSACGGSGAACSACAAGSDCQARLCVAGGGGGTDAGASGYATVQDAEDALAREFCEHLVRCGAASTQATCEATIAQFGFLGDGFTEQAASAKDMRSIFDGAKTKACLEAYGATAACGGDFLDTDPGCEAAFAGTVTAGGTCFIDDDCVDGHYCTGTKSVCPGTCAVRKAAGVAATEQRECLKGLVLYNGRCTTRVSDMGTCAPVTGTTLQQPCAQASFCDPADDICRPRKAATAPCAADTECKDLLVCQNGTCGARAKLTETCQFQFPGTMNPSIQCQIDLRCDFAQLGSPGVCKVRAVQGEPCWLTALDCGPDLYCDGATFGPTVARGTCQATLAVGATCAVNEECDDALFCDAATKKCAAKKAIGASCSGTNVEECGARLECRNVGGNQCAPSSCQDPAP